MLYCHAAVLCRAGLTDVVSCRTVPCRAVPCHSVPYRAMAWRAVLCRGVALQVGLVLTINGIQGICTEEVTDSAGCKAVVATEKVCKPGR